MPILEVVQSINLTFRAGLKIMFALSVAWSKRALEPNSLRLTKNRSSRLNRD